MKLIKWIVLMSLIQAASGKAMQIHVPTNAPTVQAGINAALDGDTVVVAPGVYFENLRMNGKNIVLTSHWLYDQDPRFIFETILDGSCAQSDTGSVILVADGEDSTCIIQGFTITGGTGTPWYDPNFGGVRPREGGGILTHFSSPTIRFNYITANDAITPGPNAGAGGGGLRCGDGRPYILNNLITHNRGIGYAQGVLMLRAPGVIRNNVIAYNNGSNGSPFDGGGLLIARCSTTVCIVENNTIMYNRSLSNGTGVSLRFNPVPPRLRNNIVYHNTGNGSQIGLVGTAADVRYCNVEDGFAGIGNIDVEPQLGGFLLHPEAGSPMIDAGDPAAGYFDRESAASGVAQWPSLGSLHNDLGATGGPGAFPLGFGEVVTDSTVGWAPVTFEYSYSGPFDTSASTWHWGDGADSSGGSSSHTFTQPGVYHPSIEVDTGGAMVLQGISEPVIVLADSLIGNTVDAIPGSTVVVTINATNTLPLERLVLPIVYSGDAALQYDSVSTVDCRTEAFQSVERVYANASAGEVVIAMRSIQFGGCDPLPAGSGPVLKLYFTASPSGTVGDTTAIRIQQVASYQPSLEGPLLNVAPRISDGAVTLISCCIGNRGDIDGDGVDADAIDLSFLVDYLFSAGSVPACDDEADLNADGAASDAVDLSYLVDYLFAGGAPPQSCQE